jgi:hypothetical protein
MNGATAKLVVLAVLSLAAGSLTALLSETPSEMDEMPQPVVSDANREPTTMALRIVAKYRVARDVIAGRFSLLEGAALFGALNQVSPRAPELSLLDVQESLLDVPGRTGEERLCRQLILYAGWELAAEPDRARAVVARMKADFNQELWQEGSIRLPDSSSLVTAQELLEQARAELTDRGVLSEKVTAREDRDTGWED